MSRVSAPRLDQARFIAGLGALFIVSFVVFLAAGTLLPRLILGWESVAITSESMAPSIETGDVVVAAPRDGEGLDPGMVVVFRDPARSGLITHRIISVDQDGRYVTRGDASHEPDSTPLPPENVVGVGRLLVPLAGYPTVWWLTGRWFHILAALAGLFASVWMARWAFRPDPRAAGPRRARQAGTGTATALVIVLVFVVAGPTFSRAAFATSTVSAGNTLTGAGSFSSDSFRVTTYEVGDGVFTGLTYTLTLGQDLAPDYFVILRGAAGANDSGTNRNPDQDYARVSGDPYSDFPVVTGSNQLQLRREAAAGSWQGQVTIVESIANQATSGFRLLDVVEVTMGPGATTGSAPSSVPWSDINQVGLYGGIRGGGVSTTTSVRNDHVTAWARIYPSATNTIALERQAGGAALSGTTVFTVYAVEWGSEWTIQRVTVSGSKGGNGINLPGHYDVSPISPTPRNSTFVLGYGTTADNGLGDGWEGQVFTLGNGVTQLATESTVAVGAEYAKPRVVEVYVHSHPSLAVDYRFGADGANPGIPSGALSGSAAIDAALAGETYTNGSSVQVTAGYRFGIISNSSNGTGTAYPRPMVWARPTAPATATWTRTRSGQSGAFWLQIVDFANIAG